MARGRNAALLVVAIGVGACAAPSRRLTPRVVEDPIVLPRGMASAWAGTGITYTQPSGRRAFPVNLGFRYGITDRLEWDELLSLRYALLDDRPADGRPARPVSLAIGAGFLGLGYSSLQGFIMFPRVSVELVKHVADRWRLGASVEWVASWIQKPAVVLVYTDELGYSARRRSFWSLDVWAARQLTERFALAFDGWFSHAGACLSPTCDWVTQSTGASLRLSFRPWHWLTVSAGPHAGLRYRPQMLPPPGNPTDPVVVPPRVVEWVGIWGGFSFYW